MCDVAAVVAVAGLAINVASTVNQANEQNKASQDNAENARKTAQNNMGLLSLRQMQEAAAANQTIYQMDLEARKAKAQTAVSAGESGVAGTSVDLLLADIDRQQLQAQEGTKRNLEGTLSQLEQEKKVVSTNMQSQINSVPAANPWATGLKIGGAGVDAGTSYINLRSKGTKNG